MRPDHKYRLWMTLRQTQLHVAYGAILTVRTQGPLNYRLPLRPIPQPGRSKQRINKENNDRKIRCAVSYHGKSQRQRTECARRL